MDNRNITRRLLQHARELEATAENLYRVRAFRRAADTIERLDEPISELLARAGRRGLRDLPGIGAHIAFTLEQLVQTGELHTFPSRRKLGRL